jgi:hypothetical protein
MIATVDEGLLALRALLEDPERWTQHAQARDANGSPCGPDLPEARSWCLKGGTYKAADDYGALAEAMMRALSRRLPGNTYTGRPVALGIFNDFSTHAQVLALIDGARR